MSNFLIPQQNWAIKALRLSEQVVQQIPKSMKLSVLALFCSAGIAWSAESYAQEAKVSLNAQNETVQTVLNEIEEQSDFSFFFNVRHIDLDRRVSLSVEESDVFNVLDKIFAGTDVTYKVLDRKIILTKAEGKASQQNGHTVTGKVVDKNGEPIIGANIVVKGTNNGTITDVDGNFTLQVPSNAQLIFSFIGYITQDIVVGNQSTLNVTLNEDAEALDELVVIGYGTTTKKEFTGSVSSVRLEDSPISLVSNTNVLESLKGTVSGIDIGATNSAGAQPSMLVRGQRSISGSNDPLIVVDGVIFMGSINDINPNDISTIDVLKDATSAAAYGSRSANGVIAITTKKGKTGKPIINLNITGSMQKWHRQPKLLNGQQWLDMVRDKNKYDDYSFLYDQEKINADAGKETNWLDETTRTGWMQDYQVSVSGAGEKMNYYVSTSYTDNKGIVRGDDYSRMTILGKINTNITDWLQIGLDAAYTHSDYSGVGANLTAATILSPYDMMYRANSNKLERHPNGKSEAINPLWNVDSKALDDKDFSNNMRMNAFAVLKMPWIKGLSYRLNYSGNLNYQRLGQFYHESYYAPIGAYDDDSRYSITAQQNYLANANGNVRNIKTTSWVVDNILSYKNRFGKHSLDLTAVATRDSKTINDESMIGKDFSQNGNTALGMNGLHYAKIQKWNANNVKRRNAGYFTRASYSYNDTYYLTTSYRRDGASVFGAENKWGNFWAFGTAWLISNEPFMQRLSFLNSLKLKLSWGKNGNQGIDPYGTLSTVSSGSSGGYFYTFGNSGTPSYAIRQSVLGNALLGWETTESWNFGFESSWIDNRISVDLDVYFSKTYDQIFNRSIPVMTGFVSMKSSMGEVKNRGVEMAVRTVNLQNRDWNWSSVLTFWLNRNTLNHLYGEDMDGDGKEDDDMGNNLFIGKSIHSIFGYKQNGIVQTDDIDYIKANGVEPGTPKYVDINEDGIINVDDRTIVGNTDPRFKLSFDNTLSWKNVELYVLFTGAFGGKGYFLQKNIPAYMAGGRGDFFSANNIYVPYWTTSNPSNKYPAAWFTGDGKFMGLQGRGYVRLQDITLSYTFTQPSIKRIGIDRLRLYFTGKNLLTITGWKGGDPEIGNTITEGTWPVATTLSLGVNISF